MHGLLYAELKKYAVARFGAEGWNRVLRDAGMSDRIFLPNQVYSDSELVTLVAKASEITGKNARDIERDFGEFLAPDLLALYQGQINPAWRTLDLVQHTEEFVHRTVRVRMPSADPPRLRAVRATPSEVVIHYDSPRRLCAVAVGIVQGVAAHYGDAVRVEEARCMHRGDPACEIHVATI